MSKGMRDMIQQVVEIITEFDSIAPVNLSIGYTDERGFCRQGLLITECPAIVIKTLVGCGYHLRLSSKGVFVYDNVTKNYE